MVLGVSEPESRNPSLLMDIKQIGTMISKSIAFHVFQSRLCFCMENTLAAMHYSHEGLWRKINNEKNNSGEKIIFCHLKFASGGMMSPNCQQWDSHKELKDKSDAERIF